MQMKRLRWFVGLVSIAMVASACGGSNAPAPKATGSAGKIIEGGVFRIGSTNGIDSLNPFVGFNADSYTTYMYVYPYLVQYGPGAGSNFQGDFATSWTTSTDGTVWTFTLRDGAKWSDGQPLSSADALFSFNTYLKYKNGPAGYYAGTIAHLKSVAAPDATHFVLTYASPVANVLSQMQQIPILPEHIWRTYATGDGKGLRTFPNPAPVVAGGPFILQQFTKGASALFSPNPNWYGSKPHVEGWGFQFFKNDDAMITALKNHEIDAIETLPATSVATVKAAGFKVNASPGLEFHDFIINSNPNKPNHRELLDPQVRAAMDQAIDRDKIVQTSYLGYAKPGSSIVSPADGIWYDKSIQPPAFDLDAANQILDQTGKYPKGADGIRTADGHPMSYTVIFPQSLSGAGDRSFQIIQADFQQIGIKLTQKTLDDSAAFDAILAPDNKYLDFDLSMWDWVPYNDPDFLLSVLTCGQYGSWSDTAYCNKAYDQLYDQQAVTIEQSQRVQIVYQMQQIIANDRPYLVIDYPDTLEAVDAKWTGYVTDPGAGSFSSDSKLSMTQIHQTG
jgi:peptide/nickel transport system substrate-binding protein